MQINIGEKKFSLNHTSIGTRFSGSYHVDERDECSYTDPAEGYVERQGEFSDWAENAQIGDQYTVAPSTYWARVE